jgi:phosphatidate phosphatase APP1
VVVTIAITGGVTDTLTATTDSLGNYTISKNYPVTATINASAVASVNADSTSASASSITVAFQIAFNLLKRALTLVIS